LDKAKKYLDEIIKESPKNVDANYMKGTLHAMKGEAASAVASFRTVVNERPQFIPAYIGLANAHAQNKEMNLALDTLQSALKISPDSRDIARALARFYAVQKDYAGAETQYRKILNANPNDMEVQADMGDLMVASRNFKRAEEIYGTIKRRLPQSPVGYMKLSSCYAAQGKWGQATSELEQLLNKYPNQWNLANDLAYLLADYGQNKRDLDRALALATKAYQLNPNNPNVFDTIGWVHARRGEYQQAIDWLGKAYSILPKNPVISYHLGTAFYQVGDRQKAKTYLTYALALNTEFSGKANAQKLLADIR